MVDFKEEIADAIGGIFALLVGLVALVLLLIGACLLGLFVLYASSAATCWVGADNGCEAIQNAHNWLRSL